jgi:AcrR family transcriptional regulator
VGKWYLLTMTSEELRDSASGQRGAPDHNVRQQIIAAAYDYFAHYGYGKTTVADLAKAIGFSKAYIYKFFGSKQAIGQAICAQCSDEIIAETNAAVEEGRTATDKLRRFFRAIIKAKMSLLFNERRLYDVSSVSATERWPAYLRHGDQLLAMVTEIVQAGRESGEFERKTPLDETCRAILQAMQPFINSTMLEYNIDLVPDGANEVVNLVLRSLAP